MIFNFSLMKFYSLCFKKQILELSFSLSSKIELPVNGFTMPSAFLSYLGLKFPQLNFQINYVYYFIIIFNHLTFGNLKFHEKKLYLISVKQISNYQSKVHKFFWSCDGVLIFSKLSQYAMLQALHHGTIIRTGIIYKKILCYMCNSPCEWCIVENAKIF